MKKNRVLSISLSSLLLVLSALTLSSGSIVFAEETTPASSTTQSAPDNTYHYNEATGLWENGTYSWDPNTGQTAPLQQQTYSYNPSSGAWDTNDWRYDTSAGAYVANEPPAVAPATNNNLPENNDANKTTNDSAGESTTADPASAKTLASSSEETSKPQGPYIHDQNDAFFAGFYNASISNKFDSVARSGDATVSNNTTAGNATSGNALALATLINLLQSYWGAGGGKLLTFNQDINGNVVGDLYIDPRSLQPSNTAAGDGNTVVKQQTNSLIDNDINLGASSGNANVTGNTTAGNATSGNANAVANLINILNSAISSGQSFMGIINIFGNFEGDILLPQDVLNTLLSSNGPSVPVTNADVSLNNNQTITNNIDASAQSGSANVAGNTTAGNATTGNANTQITLLNLTGRQIIAKDTLLVFVNVLGRWVGVLMNAPSGSTAAALGSGVTANTTAPAGDIEMHNDSNSTINNNIQVAASTGDATVTNNTTAGNATSGNATASVNLLNIIGSDLSFSDWFGVLFINVFGSWLGSFGVNTPYGDPAAPVATPTSTSNTSGVFSFTPGASTPTKATQITYYVYGTHVTSEYITSSTDDGQTDSQNPVVLANSDQGGPSSGIAALAQSNNGNAWVLPLLGILIGAMLIGGNSAYELAQRRRETAT